MYEMLSNYKIGHRSKRYSAMYHSVQMDERACAIGKKWPSETGAKRRMFKNKYSEQKKPIPIEYDENSCRYSILNPHLQVHGTIIKRLYIFYCNVTVSLSMKCELNVFHMYIYSNLMIAALRGWEQINLGWLETSRSKLTEEMSLG